MSKDFLVKKVREEADCTTAVAEAAVDAVLQGIMDGAANGGLTLIGFGSFKVVDKPARVGRNPQTGKEMQIPARKAVKFSPGKKFKDAVS
jgi:DNA-binding protein HU-beta